MRSIRENYISRLMYHVDAMDFDLSRERGLDIAMMKSIVDHHYWFAIRHHKMFKEEILTMDGRLWTAFSSDYIIEWVPLWEKEKAISLFNTLVSDGLIECKGTLNDESVLICCE